MNHRIRLRFAAGLCLGSGILFGADPTPEQRALLVEAKALFDQAVKQRSAGSFDEALVSAKKSLEIRQEILGRKHADTASSFNSVGVSYYELGDYAAARSNYEQALAIRREIFGLKHPDTAFTLTNLGQTQKQLADFPAAKANLEQALTIFKEVRGLKHNDTARAFDNLGSFLRAAGDTEGAKAHFEQALAIRREVLGPKHIDTAASLNNLALHFKLTGELAAAKAYFEEALPVVEELKGLDHPQTATMHVNLGTLHQAMGDFPAAKRHLDRALAIDTERLGAKHVLVANDLNNLGALLYAMRDNAAAKTAYEEALAIRREKLGPTHPETSAVLNNLGVLLVTTGEFDAARRYLEEALALKRERQGPTHPDVAAPLKNLGFLHQEAGDYALAKDYLQQALALRRDAYGPTHISLVEVLDNLYTASAARGLWPEAAAAEDEARRIVRKHVASVLPALGQRQQLQFVRTTDDPAFFRALSLGLRAEENSLSAIRSAEWLANGKAVIQESLAESAALAAAGGDPAVKKLVDDLKAVRAQLARLTQTTPKPAEAAEFRKNLELLETQERAAATAVNARLGRGGTEPWVSLAAIRRGIPNNAAFVDLARIRPYDFAAKSPAVKFQPPRYVAWILSAREDSPPAVIDLGDAQTIDDSVAALQAALRPCQSPDKAVNPIFARGEKAAEEQLREALSALSRLLLDPLRPRLANAAELILSPDANLWLVPWAALPTDEGYAVEKWSLRYVTSARDLVGAKRSPSANPPRILADPDFDLAPAEQSVALASVLGGPVNSATPAAAPSRTNDLRTRSATRTNAADPLPGTGDEARAITPHLEKFTQTKLRVYDRRLALEGILKRLNAPRVLVLSTHGFFLPEQAPREAGGPLVDASGAAIENPLLRCGLLLAGCNQRDRLPADSTLDDGVLTGMEIVGVNLRGTELVVLSACETGLGRVDHGQGVAGLRQAIQLAGAQSVVATLWQIPDQATAQLMNDFFAELAAGRGKAAALRNAQLNRIRARREKFGAAHPLYWAAFTVTGRD